MPRKPLDAAVADLSQAVGQLVRRMRAAAAGHELSLSESAVLARLAHGGAATTAELARAEGVRPQSMGATVAALEERGLVQRRPHPTDGRQLIVELSRQGAAVRDRAVNAKRTWLAHAVEQLDEADQQALFKAGEIIRRLAQQ